jgi:hypothetical protein
MAKKIKGISTVVRFNTVQRGNLAVKIRVNTMAANPINAGYFWIGVEITTIRKAKIVRILACGAN